MATKPNATRSNTAEVEVRRKLDFQALAAEMHRMKADIDLIKETLDTHNKAIVLNMRTINNIERAFDAALDELNEDMQA